MNARGQGVERLEDVSRETGGMESGCGRDYRNSSGEGERTEWKSEQYRMIGKGRSKDWKRGGGIEIFVK